MLLIVLTADDPWLLFLVQKVVMDTLGAVADVVVVAVCEQVRSSPIVKYRRSKL